MRARPGAHRRPALLRPASLSRLRGLPGPALFEHRQQHAARQTVEGWFGGGFLAGGSQHGVKPARGGYAGDQRATAATSALRRWPQSQSSGPATNVSPPSAVRIRPSECSSLTALAAVVVETPHSWLIRAIEGSIAPGGSSPLSMR